ncbi:MAG TPA: hypothetical protein VHP83_14310 [Aggregatilineaceae bacterium]|nr:hypothetical protein [Aggregatilineaceae bacterium]
MYDDDLNDPGGENQNLPEKNNEETPELPALDFSIGSLEEEDDETAALPAVPQVESVTPDLADDLVSESPVDGEEGEADDETAILPHVSLADQSTEAQEPDTAPVQDETMIDFTPPRIVAETPLGGVARPSFVPPPAPVERPPDPLIMAPAAIEPPTADQIPTWEEPPTLAEEKNAMSLAESEAPTQLEMPAVPSAAEPLTPQTQRVTSSSPTPVPPPPPKALGTPQPEMLNRETLKDWGEDLSPELAAILLKPSGAAPTPSAGRAAPPPPAASVAPPAPRMTGAAPLAAPGQAQTGPIPTPAALPPAEPIFLTEVGQTQRLPITAEGVNSPAPDVPLVGQGRHVRVEEPITQAQRNTDTWEYLKTSYPPLEGRLVKSVRIVETNYSDGSWAWSYERRYTDGGFDVRKVRASIDRMYIERHDELKKRDPLTGKMVKHVEGAAMIYAPPMQEEKRGLFGRRHDAPPSGPQAWRAATKNEIKQLRKVGGLAW